MKKVVVKKKFEWDLVLGEAGGKEEKRRKYLEDPTSS